MSKSADTITVVPASALFSGVYNRLMAMAGKHRARAGSPVTYSTTEIVHDLYLRMCDDRELQFGRELEFFAYAARAMRHLLVDVARKRMSFKEGGDLARVNLTDPAVGAVSLDPGVALQLDAALNALEQDSARAAQVVELHYFAGLPLERVAELTSTSRRTVDRDWRYARAFLSTHMEA